MLVMLVKAMMVFDEQEDVQTTYGTYREAYDVDKAERSVLQQKTNGGFKIAFEHMQVE